MAPFQAKRKRESASKKCCAAMQSIWIVGDIIRAFGSVFTHFSLQCTRRRNSYRLSGYFAFYALLCALRSIVCFTSILSMNNHFNEPPSTECDLVDPSGNQTHINPTYDEMVAATMSSHVAIKCREDEWGIFGGITPSFANSFLAFYWFLAVESAVCFTFCAVLSFLFNYFSGVPMSAFHVANKGCWHQCMMRMGGFCKHGLWIMNFLTFWRIAYLIAQSVMIFTDLSAIVDMSGTYNCAVFDWDCVYTRYFNCRLHRAQTGEDMTACLDLKTRDDFPGHVDFRILPNGCFREQAIAAVPTPYMFELVNRTAYISGFEPGGDTLAKVETAAEGKCADETTSCFRMNEDACKFIEVGCQIGEPSFTIPKSVICSDERNLGRMPPNDYYKDFWDPDDVWRLKEQHCIYLPDKVEYYTTSEMCTRLEQSVTYKKNMMIFISEVTCFCTLVICGTLTKKFVQPETIFFSPPRSQEHRFWQLVHALGPE